MISISKFTQWNIMQLKTELKKKFLERKKSISNQIDLFKQHRALEEVTLDEIEQNSRQKLVDNKKKIGNDTHKFKADSVFKDNNRKGKSQIGHVNSC